MLSITRDSDLEFHLKDSIGHRLTEIVGNNNGLDSLISSRVVFLFHDNLDINLFHTWNPFKYLIFPVESLKKKIFLRFIIILDGYESGWTDDEKRPTFLIA